MTDPDDDTIVPMKLRFPQHLHAGVAEAAREAGMSMNTWMVRQVTALLAATPTATPTGRRAITSASYLAELTFTLSGGEIDTQAHRLTEQMVNMTELAGGSAVSSRVLRTIPIQPRNS
jgi:hypothetical protein